MRWCQCGRHALDTYLQPVLLLAIRLYVARAFFMSGLTKVHDWSATLALFRDEYHVPVLPPALAAVMGAGGELIFSILLAFGLFGRLGALGLFFVNLMAVISYPALFEFECPAAINDHFYWGALLLVVLAFGSGKLSVDFFACRKWADCKK
ncbi:MAG: DoxX family protein [Burkholderiaceae bacterium]|nr:MAG: DoxX family protein [Burkholderiaceae bacterium]